MDDLAEFLARVGDEERVELVTLMWLYQRAPEAAQLSAMARLHSLLRGGVVDIDLLMTTVRELTEELQNSIDAFEVRKPG